MQMFERIAAAVLVLCFSGALFAKTTAKRQASCRNIVTATLLAMDRYAPDER